jgi:hypothetical protein
LKVKSLLTAEVAENGRGGREEQAPFKIVDSRVEDGVCRPPFFLFNPRGLRFVMLVAVAVVGALAGNRDLW